MVQASNSEAATGFEPVMLVSDHQEPLQGVALRPLAPTPPCQKRLRLQAGAVSVF